MAAPSAIREGLRVRLATITGLTGYAKPKGTPVLPAGLVLPRQIAFDETMGRGSDLLNFEVLILVSLVTADMAAEDLDPYLAGSGSQSVKEAIEADATLAGAVEWTVVKGVTDYGDVEYSGKLYLGARFVVEVLARGTS